LGLKCFERIKEEVNFFRNNLILVCLNEYSKYG
jgi:hypothetical protein